MIVINVLVTVRRLREIIKERLDPFASHGYDEQDFEIDRKHLRQTIELASAFIDRFGRAGNDVLRNPWVAKEGEELLQRMWAYKAHDTSELPKEYDNMFYRLRKQHSWIFDIVKRAKRIQKT